MSKRRSSKYHQFALPLQRSDLDTGNATKECLTQFDNLASRDIWTIQTLNLVSIIYGATFLTYLLQNDNFLHLGKLISLYIPIVHTILEYLKIHMQRSKTIRFETPKHLNVLLKYLTCTSLCYCITVLFGAEVISDVEETFVFSAILTAFVLLPSYLYYGPESLYLLTHQKVAYSPLYSSIRSVAYGSVLGAWFGAFVIPLDWERNWQQWPIPCVLGSLIGFVLGHAHSLVSLI